MRPKAELFRQRLVSPRCTQSNQTPDCCLHGPSSMAGAGLAERLAARLAEKRRLRPALSALPKARGIRSSETRKPHLVTERSDESFGQKARGPIRWIDLTVVFLTG